MDVKSFSCKVRNNLSEISFIESILYVSVSVLFRKTYSDANIIV